ncbi:MAG: Gfo/Idh/MocA family protein [Planctomycetota bacterium]
MTVGLGCIGYGAWGRNVARVAASTPGARLLAVADLEAERREEARERHPGVEILPDDESLLRRDDLDAVLIATDAASHADLVVRAAERRRHVFVEKPLALCAADARRAVAAAREMEVRLQVGHLLRYHPAVEVLFDVVRGELGTLRSVACQRLNFGAVRRDESVLFSLGAHDLSLMLALFGRPPESVAAHGAAYVQQGVEDLAFVTLRFPGGGIGQMHLSWLDPHKVRRVTVVGSEAMAVFDDMEPREKVRIYDQAVRPPESPWIYGENLSLRYGSIRIPPCPAREPLRVELAHFVECLRQGRPPRTGGEEGLRVVEILEAAQRSLRAGGAPAEIGR